MDTADAWSAYWTQMGDAGGCLPGAPPAVEAELARTWSQFARGFDRGSRLIDLACGTGAVMRSLLRGNGDLDLVGVDYAALPKSRSKKIRLIGGTDIANLPFDDGHFDGLTSQFGVEYADIEACAPEMACVAKPGARFQFVIHHADSPIVGQNRRRHAALSAIAGSAIFDMARTAAAQPRGNTAMLSQTFSLIARSHPDQSVVREIAAGMDHAIRLGGKKSAAELERIETNIAQECEVLAALLGVAQDEQGIAAFAKHLASDFECRPARPIRPAGLAAPIAWALSGSRRE
ncbi:methyltransferase domain-containing protein [Parasphingopyxis algicola]|uniref:class I SAM-dependent methyltransferase n=1 Tax=Parasphingopyxis algicola TaxID=2026624 RepID=UPI0015A0BB27|nr:methyltransferase domain-containing protein [Parasphingopyxis algicola]QLC25494.1 methyltransferase domain-containing protein [Parasphingopyxis algicola]